MDIFLVEVFQSFSDERETYVCASMEAVNRQLDQAAKECACDDDVNRTWFEENDDVYWVSVIKEKVIE